MPTPPQIQAAVDEVLRRKEFSDVAGSAKEKGFWQKLLDWLNAQTVFGSVPLGRLIGWIIVGLLAAALLYTLLTLVRSEPLRMRGARARRSPGAASDDEQGRSPVEPSALLLRAEGALSASDLRGAVQLLLHASIAALAGAGHVVVERWKTNTAYLRECPRTVEQFPLLTEAIGLHEELVYAHRAPDPARIRALLGALRGFCGSI